MKVAMINPSWLVVFVRSIIFLLQNPYFDELIVLMNTTLGKQKGDTWYFGKGFSIIYSVLYCASKGNTSWGKRIFAVMNGHNSTCVPYSPNQITRAEDMLNLTRKRGVTTYIKCTTYSICSKEIIIGTYHIHMVWYIYQSLWCNLYWWGWN